MSQTFTNVLLKVDPWCARLRFFELRKLVARLDGPEPSSHGNVVSD